MSQSRTSRTFIKVDDAMPEHPKIEELSDAAFRALIEMWCYCARHLNDGRVTARAWKKRVADHVTAELIDAGMVEMDGETHVMHDYLDYQRSREHAQALSKVRQQAGRLGGQQKAKQNAKQNAKQTDSKLSSREEKRREEKTPPLRTDVEALCEHLASRIESNGSKRPNIVDGWRDAARLLIDKDARAEDEAHRLIDWCQDSEFWRSNVLSMGKFREKYDQLRLQATQQRNGNAPVTREARNRANGLPEGW